MTIAEAQQNDSNEQVEELTLYTGMTEPVDDSSALDALDDPVRETTDKFYSMGEVISGHGLEGGTFVDFGGYKFPNILAPAPLCEGKVYGVVSYNAHQQLYTNPATSNSLFQGTVEPFFGPTLSPRDAPDHTKYRAIMQRGFTPKQIENYKDAVVRPVLERRFAALKQRGSADLVRAINIFYPYEIVGRIVGFDLKDIEFVAHCMDKMWQGNRDVNVALEGGRNLKEYTLKLINMRRADPRDDYVSILLDAEVDGEKIDDDNLVGLVNHFLSGGIETTSRQTSMLVYDLLSNPDQLELLRNNRELIPAAVEENLRHNGIGGSTCRKVLDDIEICGKAIPEGSVVFTFHLAANRDPSRWENPHKFDITRPVQKQLTFAMGPHMCIGQHFARFLLSEFLTHFLDDLPNVRWDPDQPVPKPRGWNQRACTTQPVVWDV